MDTFNPTKYVIVPVLQYDIEQITHLHLHSLLHLVYPIQPRNSLET